MLMPSFIHKRTNIGSQHNINQSFHTQLNYYTLASLKQSLLGKESFQGSSTVYPAFGSWHQVGVVHRYSGGIRISVILLSVDVSQTESFDQH